MSTSTSTNCYPLAYAGSVQYYTHLIQQEEVLIDITSPYQRKTYRNRCDILGTNGLLSLSVPVINHKNERTELKDTHISYAINWQKQHWRSIESAYNNSPFFEYYQDALLPFYQKNYDYLIDFNCELTQCILDELGSNTQIQPTKDYQAVEKRFLINPKVPCEVDTHFTIVNYRQVFSEKHPFTPNLSVLDLLFNKGPEALSILEESYGV